MLTESIFKHAERNITNNKTKREHGQSMFPFLYKENHALDAWFNEAYGDE